MFEAERKQASFDIQELANFIYGSPTLKANFLTRQAMLQNDPVLRFDPAILGRSRSEIMSTYARKLVRYTELIPNSDSKFFEKTLFFGEQVPLSLHDSMFLTTLKNLCDQQQVKSFLQPAIRYEITGCYAQTELGHGSDVQNLMTTATYDQTTETFVMNTPCTKAAKWWIGDLGIFSTHACVFAQLITKGKKHGVHAFVVPIRDKDHKALPGIEAGDIGPKFGYNSKDNGYLIMKEVRIPRKNMLMKYHRVSKEGDYEIVGKAKITYATMLRTRAIIPLACYYHLSKAITISVRYSIARTQFKDSKGKENPIINYQLQQQKLFPRISETYANLFAVQALISLSDQILQQAQQGKFTQLNEGHIITSSVKAICTKDSYSALQILRRAAGGHGYNAYSNLPMLQVESSPTYTFEGDFTILMLQVARYLLKSYNRIHRDSGKRLAPTIQYLQQAIHLDTVEPWNSENPSELRDPAKLLQAYAHNSCFRVKKAAEKILSGVTSGTDMKQTWDEHAGIELVEAATAHSYYWMVKNYFQKVATIQDKNTRNVMEKLALLYAVDKIHEYSVDFFEAKSMTALTLQSLRALREKLFEEIRPDALALVESFLYSDNTLSSAIGTADGKPYEHLLDCFRNSNDVNKPENAAELRRQSLRLYNFHASLLKPKI